MVSYRFSMYIFYGIFSHFSPAGSPWKRADGPVPKMRACRLCCLCPGDCYWFIDDREQTARLTKEEEKKAASPIGLLLKIVNWSSCTWLDRGIFWRYFWDKGRRTGALDLFTTSADLVFSPLRSERGEIYRRWWLFALMVYHHSNQRRNFCLLAAPIFIVFIRTKKETGQCKKDGRHNSFLEKIVNLSLSKYWVWVGVSWSRRMQMRSSSEFLWRI